MPDAPVLELRGVVAGYGRLTILHGVDLAIEAGRMTTLIGANGAGKSTVFKAVFGLLPLMSGEIRFAGERIDMLAPRERLRRGIVFVPQGRNLFPRMTVRQNLELGGVTLDDAALRTRRMAEVFDRFPRLAQRAGQQASTLSGGEQKQLEIGRALLLEPRLLLIDEPSIGLAPKIVADVFALLRQLTDSGVAVAMVEQNVKSALLASHRAVALEQGRVLLVDDAAAMLDDARVKAMFLGGRAA
jgi:branched-chain amino acid transport system ATP-binding protein